MQTRAIRPRPHEYVHANAAYSSESARNSEHANTGFSAASERTAYTQTRAISPHPHE